MDQHATLARVITLDTSITIPSEFVKGFNDQKRKNAVIIYSPANEFLRIFLTSASEVFKVETKINSLDHEFLGSLGSFLGHYGITPLYANGFCRDDRCLYEGYFEKDALKLSLEDFRTHFLKLKGVSDVKITQL
jgi:hypothetical protein